MRWSKLLWQSLIVLLVTVVLLEAGSFMLVRMGALLVNETPKLYLPPDTPADAGTNWWVEEHVWGTWRKPNARALHQGGCFEVEYQSNSIGARDTEFENITADPSAYVLIGDSFAEGWGVSMDDTAHRQIEERAGVNVLNFGSAGHFGPVQYWLVYQKLARNYAHDGLIIFFLPANDFTDNDYDLWSRGKTYLDREKKQERHRPYYRYDGLGSYDYFIPPDAVKRDQWFAAAETTPLKQLLKDNFWFANTIRTLNLIMRSYREQSAGAAAEPSYAGYFDATHEQQRAAVFFIDKLISSTTASTVLLVAIPVRQDFDRIKQGQQREQMLWWQAFASASDRLGRPVSFLDLVDYAPADTGSLFLPCDGHWSAQGNAWAAETIARELTRLGP